jgi:hypothetical protein
VRIASLSLLAVLALIGTACTETSDATPTAHPPVSVTTTTGGLPANGVLVPPAQAAAARNQIGYAFPEPPPVPDGPADPALVADVTALFDGLATVFDLDLVQRVAASGDPRAAWLIADLMRFVPPGDTLDQLTSGFERLTGISVGTDPVAARSPWQSATDHLIAWDLPALGDYPGWKGKLFALVDPRWQPFFDDADAAIDWRWVGWGGVLMDDRPLGTPARCELGCIPALDDPAVTDAAGGDWYPDERPVFGITLGGESRAYPKHIMEVHEMVNDTLGGRRLGIPYCTLCGSAQAYLTDSVPDGIEVPVLRTSGLLSRSNKVMFDLVTFSVFDTFTGTAVSGPLQDAGVVLEQVSVVTSTWGEWKAAHPDTTVVARDGGIGRSYDLDPLRGRDNDGPIFPIGDVDERLAVQQKVLGVILDDGTPLAVPVDVALAHLAAGGTIAVGDVTIVAEGSGIRAVRADGTDAGGHEAFWFAWSQFHHGTLVWQPPEE